MEAEEGNVCAWMVGGKRGGVNSRESAGDGRELGEGSAGSERIMFRSHFFLFRLDKT